MCWGGIPLRYKLNKPQAVINMVIIFVVLHLNSPKTLNTPEIFLGVSSFLSFNVRNVEAFLAIKLLTFNDLPVCFLVCTVSVLV